MSDTLRELRRAWIRITDYNDRIVAVQIRPGFWMTVLAIALGVLLGVYAAAWLDGQDNTPEALGLSVRVQQTGPVLTGGLLIGHRAGYVGRVRPVAVAHRHPVVEGVRGIAAVTNSLRGSPRVGIMGTAEESAKEVHARSVARPNPDLTLGVARELTRKQICETKWSLDRRHVTLAMKQHVAAAYGIPWSQHSQYEFDHLIPRELGGADVESNLWPQPWIGPYNAHDKDRLENQLRRLVCTGQITLEFAQDAISSDWIAAFRLYVPASR